MKAIYKREFMSLFHTYVGWFFLGITLFLIGDFIWLYNLRNGVPSLSYMLQSVTLLVIFMVPVLTMRSFAEERKLKTDQLILTAPVSVGQVVLGKFLALVTVYAIPVVFVGVFPLIFRRAGEFQTGVSYASLLGFFLYGVLALSIGLFISSLTESMVISAVVTFVVLFLGYLMIWLRNLILMGDASAFSRFLSTTVLKLFDMVEPFDNLCMGYFNLSSVAYYATFTCFWLIAAMYAVQRRKSRVLGKGFRLGTDSLPTVVLAAVLFVAASIGTEKIPKQYTSFDVTANKMYTLTEETKEMLKGLSDDVTIYVLAENASKDLDLDKTLQHMASLSSHLKVEYVSPASSPMFYYKYTAEAPSVNSLIVTAGQNNAIIDYSDIYAYEFDYEAYDYQAIGYDGEGQVISAISRVLTEGQPKFYIIRSGHGERQFEDAYLSVLAKENVAYEALALYSVEEIPNDAQGIIIYAPTADYSTEDVGKITAYLERGGNALFVSTWTDAAMPNYESLLAFYGISLVDGIIVEKDKSHYSSGNPYNLIPTIYEDEVTKRITDMAICAPASRGLSYDEERKDVYYTPLLVSSEESFSQVDVLTAQDYEKAEGDIDGPFVVCLKAEKEVQADKTSTAFMLATEMLFTVSADSLFPGNSMKLFGSMISSMAKREASVLVPMKYFNSSYLVFNEQAVSLAGFLITIVPLTFCLTAGFVIWWKRRRR